jgi:hypothetical protein
VGGKHHFVHLHFGIVWLGCGNRGVGCNFSVAILSDRQNIVLHPAFIGLGHCRFFNRWLDWWRIALGLFFGLACSRI